MKKFDYFFFILKGVVMSPSDESLTVRMNAIKHKLIIMSGKGGVGKSC